MYLSSRDTVVEAFTAFKTYPKRKQIILYNLIPMACMFVIGMMAGLSGINATGEPELTPLIVIAGLLGVVGVIASIAFYYLTYVKVMAYHQTGRVIENLKDFMTAGQSLFRLFWKTTILPVLIVLFAFAVMSGFSYAAAAGAGIVATVIIAIAIVAFFAWAVPKFTIIVAYLVANTGNGLRDSFAFSKGYYWYLVRILFWIGLVYIVLEIARFSLLLIGNLVFPAFIAAGWVTLVELGYLVSFTVIYIFLAFVYCNAYLKIINARASK